MRAVKRWEEDNNNNNTRSQKQQPNTNNPLTSPYWWSPTRERLAQVADSTGRMSTDGPHHTCTHHDRCVPSHFVGQGRHIGYRGLAYAVVASIEEMEPNDARPLDTITASTSTRLRQNRPPVSWVWSALAGLALVWWEIGMALMMSYNIPTVGIGCRSGSYIILGLLSTVPWLAHVFDLLGPRGAVGRRLSWVFNWVSSLSLALAVPCLVFITFAAVSRNSLLPPYLLTVVENI